MKDLLPIFIQIIVGFIALFVVVVLPLQYMQSESTQILARKQGIELTRWQAMWVSQKVLMNHSLYINLKVTE